MSQDGVQMNTDLLSKYEELAVEEGVLLQKIETCEACVEAILDCVLKKVDSIHVLTAEDLLTSVHTITTDLRTELLHLRLEKNIIDCKSSK